MASHLTGLYKVNPAQQKTLGNLFREICEILNVDEGDARSQCRQTEFVICRGVYCYIASTLTKYPLRSIASVIGGRDHATVINSRKRAKIMLDAKDAIFRNAWIQCMANSGTVKELLLKNNLPPCDLFTLQDMKDAFEAGKEGQSKELWFKRKFMIDIHDKKLYAHNNSTF